LAGNGFIISEYTAIVVSDAASRDGFPVSVDIREEHFGVVRGSGNDIGFVDGPCFLMD